MADLWVEVDFGSRKPGLMIEVPVSSESSPYLVLGMKKWIWIDSARGGFIRAAIRDGEVPPINLDIVREVAREGDLRKWGNGFPCTPEGVEKAREYLAYFDVKDAELLVGESSTVPGEVRDWIPEGCAVLIPKDKAYLGVLAKLGSKWSVVLHNPSRTVAVLGPWNPPLSSAG